LNKISLISYSKRGTQYGILAVGFNKYGSFKELEESPIKHLLDVI
jgi:hypothetical protein